MKTAIRLSVFLIIINITSSCFSDRMAKTRSTVIPLSDTVTLREGSVVYALPRTIFTVFIEMERTIEKPGPYARYAGDLLGMNNVVISENELWSIEGITIKSHEELDPSEFYVIESNTLLHTNALALKNEGLILDLNPENFYSDTDKAGINDQNISRFSSFDLGSDEYYQVQSDTAYRRVSVDSSFIRIPYIVEKKKKLTVEQMAEKAARRLMEMRDGKHLILTGEATVFPQSDAAINEINRIEKDYTELFSGKVLKEKRVFSYQIIPEKGKVGKPQVLFQFSDQTGPGALSMKGGIPVTAEFIPEQRTQKLSVIEKPTVKSEDQLFDKLFYRVPDVVNVKISMGNEILYNSRKLVYQLGEVIQLPSNYIIGK